MSQAVDSAPAAGTAAPPDRRGRPEWQGSAVAAFRQVVARHPDREAVIGVDGRLTYAELDDVTDRLAGLLAARGAGPERTVGVLLPRSVDLVVAILGILKAGAVYVPFDPEQPAQRLARIADSAELVTMVTHVDLLDSVPATAGGQPVVLDRVTWSELPRTAPVELHPDNLAYVIFTSGSTGLPKGVEVSHRALVSFLNGMEQGGFFPPRPTRVAWNASVAFDASVQEWIRVFRGDTVAVLTDEMRRDAVEFAGFMVEHRLVEADMTPSHARMLTDELASVAREGQSLRLYIAGEAMPPQLWSTLQELIAEGVIEAMNLYGPTEAAVNVTGAHVRPGDPPTIGSPLVGVEAHIVDATLAAVPDGTPGELCVAGPYLARGYSRQPGLTAARFAPNPFSSDGARMYRTGDRVLRRDDGTIQYIGRIDDQVKIRGHRVELGEIEAALARHPSVAQAVTVVRENPSGDKALVSYLVPRAGSVVDVDVLRTHLGEALPEYMIPSAIVSLPTLPLTSSGKVDHKVLPEPEPEPQATRDDSVAPRNDHERRIARVWCEVLGVDRVGVHDDFAALGGHSLLAMQMISRLRGVLGVDVQVRQIFATPTVAGLAEVLADSAGGAGEVIVPVARDCGPLVTSFAQQRLWFLDQLNPGGLEYLVVALVRVTGELRWEALRGAVSRVVERHEVLRTRLVAGPAGDPVQVVDAPPCEIVRAGDVEELVARPFDLAAGGPLRVGVVSRAVDDNVLVFCLHHVAADGWSLGVLAREVSEFYSAAVLGRAPVVASLPIQYADFAAWQRGWLAGAVLEDQLSYWRSALEGVEPLELPTDRPRPAVRGGDSGKVSFVVEPATVSALQEVAQAQGASLFMVLLAAFQLVLSRWSGQRDIAVGTPIAGRNRAEIENLVGFFVNTLVMRARIDAGVAFTDLLRQVREMALDAYAHEDLPFERLVEELAPRRDLSRHPLFDVMFSMKTSSVNQWCLPGLVSEPLPEPALAAKFDIALAVAEWQGGVRGELEYAVDLFDEVTMQRLVGHFQTLLHAVSTHPDKPLAQLSMLTTQERHQLLTEWNNTHQPVPDVLMHELLHFTDPHATAITHDNHQLTFGELDTRANQLAHHLQTLGATPDTLIALCTDRSPEMIIGLLAILRSGAAFTPLDPDHPHDRLAWLLHDTQAPIVLTTEHLHHRLPTGTHHLIRLDTDWPTITNHPTTPPKTTTTTTNLAYVIYTSGSTGHPKGVQIEHRGIVNYLHWATHHYPPHPHTTGTLLHSPATFDLTITSLFLPLIHNLPITISTHQPPFQTTALTTTSHTLIKATPSHLELLTQTTPHPHTPINIHNLVIGGEALTTSLATAIRAITTPHTTITNEYGPTEATVGCVAFSWDGDSSDGELNQLTDVPIGRPIANMRTYVLDPDGQPAPVGVPGEIFIAGVGLARGYLNRPELTADRFTERRIEGTEHRLYRTGDLGRWRPDGNLEYLGRIDNQIKLRGYRIELGEIEATLRRHDHITEAVVIAREHAPGDKRLVAYLTTPTDSPTPTPEELHTFTTRTLPDYMTPTAFHILDHLPLTPNGKVDRHALPTLNTTTTTRPPHTYTPPRNDHERRIAEVWENVLGVDRVGVHDDFFALGGHSLLAVQMISRLRGVLGVDVQVRQIFATPTVAGLAEVLADSAGGAGEVIVPVARDCGPLVTSFAQQRLWFLDQLNPGGLEYLVVALVRVTGELRWEALRGAVSRVVERHEVLRTRLVAGPAGDPVQVVDAPPCEIVRAGDVEELVARPFDLAAGGPLRVGVVSRAVDDNVLVFCLHHVAADGWSLGVLAREVSEFYSAAVLGRAPVVASLPIQYADFAAWQRGWLAGAVLEDQLSYWRSALEGVEPLELPTDRPRPAVRGGDSGKVSFVVEPATVSALQEVAQAQGASLFMVLLAAFQLVLSRWSGQRDIAVGTPIAGRNRAEIENLVGFFVNTLVMRARIDAGVAFTDLLRQVREMALDAYAHEDLPFERLVEELAPRRDLSRHPLFDVMFSMKTSSVNQWCLPGLVSEPLPEPALAAKFDIALAVAEWQGGVRGELEYAVDLFDEVTMQRLVGHFQTLLHAVSTHPDKPLAQLSMLTTDERNALHTWNNTHTTVPDLLLHELLDNHNGDPHATAIICGDQRLTFTELRHRSNQLAHHLQTLGAAPGTIVALCMHRSIDMAIALLAILKTGAAYTPLDPDHPHDRLAWLLHDTAAPLVLTQQHLTTRIPHGTHHTLTIDTLTTTLNTQPTTPPKTTTTPTDLAYVIYTSGSTGQPKGVQIHHHGIVSYLAGMQHLFPLTPNDAFLQATPLTFDVSVYEMFWPWHAGATVVLVEPEHHLDMTHYANLIDHHHITGLHLVPSLLQRFLDDTTTRPLPTLRYTFASGEHLPTTLTQQFHQHHHHHHLINLYGATEVSVDTTYWHAHPGTPTSAGHPMPNQRVHILAPDGSEAPTGATGEICLAGNSLAHGYHNRPDLTTTHFTPHPAHPHTRIYHTGDLGRRHHNGTLTLIGRTDTQIKLHGTRIELAEIETHLRTHPAIKETTVQHHQHHLTAYYTHHHPTTPNDLRHHLAKTLPTTHLPTHYIPLDHLPLTPNGKIDTHQLPTPTHQPTHPHTTPRNPLEQAITTIWQTTLKHPNPISIHDNFFTLGGHSLLATRVVNELTAATNLRVGLRQFFLEPTVAGLAQHLMALMKEQAGAAGRTGDGQHG
ncbi:non-ribosomal peptide synthetase [Micromonospora sp. AKA38]|uniref:non-ribosomal peptide synthetase n=1 Tax=Micromonospora sp. AKA38 TaxID=2733861 RepID=UPI0022C0E763|nr:non-ribosomal peptide synthetase [Micromonospora sp. AKA38]GHJ15497.1 hypothetical protein TPA0908_34920 [Micromonospora sp. AKA38]